MQIYGIKFEVSYPVLILYATAIFIIPMRWLIAMVAAAFFHEMGHLLALRVSKIAVKNIHIGLAGARIFAGPLTLRQEFLCACAGPGAGILLMGLGRIYPELAFCAFAQSAYNLIPIMPFDGGRIFRCVMETLFPRYISERIIHIVETILCAGVFILGIVCLINQLMMAGCLIILFVLLTVKGKIACNRVFSAVQ